MKNTVDEFINLSRTQNQNFGYNQEIEHKKLDRDAVLSTFDTELAEFSSYANLSLSSM